MTVGADVVRVPREKLLLGFANGWADNEKFIRVEPEDAARAVEAADLRGAMFWVIDEEGRLRLRGRYTGTSRGFRGVALIMFVCFSHS